MGKVEKCGHFKGLQPTSDMGYWCSDCGKLLNADVLAAWVREAERARDEIYPMVEGDGFYGIALEESQREVYRRRKLLYELRDTPRRAARLEMILVVYDTRGGCYECRVFYKEPKPVWCVERLSVAASEGRVQELKVHSDPVVRVAAEKVEEFHEAREIILKEGPAPTRRVFYANEL